MSFRWDRKGVANLRDAILKATNKTALDVLTNINSANVVPHDEGTLQRSGHVIETGSYDKPAKIRWATPYAARLYYNPQYNFRKGRKGRWANDWIKGSKQEFVKNAFAENMKKAMR